MQNISGFNTKWEYPVIYHLCIEKSSSGDRIIHLYLLKFGCISGSYISPEFIWFLNNTHDNHSVEDIHAHNNLACAALVALAS